MERTFGPTEPLSQMTHAEKYRGEGESFREAMNRVASALSDNPSHYQGFRDALLDMRFLPAGRVQKAMGSTDDTTPYNCFVSGTIADSFVDGHDSIMDRAKEAAATMRRGGGIGYDFSTLRPSGSLIKKLGSTTDGPIAFMRIFDSICKCVASSGHRRGAQMGVLRVDHPDIEKFVHAKQNQTDLTGFNISIAVTDEFMHAVEADGDFDLRFGHEVHRTIKARPLWEAIMRATYDWAEPGILFIDRINEMNNLAYAETIVATNPCGEQPLPPYGACLLGSFNLVKYLVWDRDLDRWAFDYATFTADIPLVVRAMDNVVDRARYPLAEQEKEAHDKRRMGLGVTGVANAIEAMGFAYGSSEFTWELGRILRTLANVAYRASAELAKEKGPFPLFDREKFLGSKFVERLEDETRELIAEYGIRNSHLTSIAPTGTISLCADNVSSGIEPVFSTEYTRDVITADGKETFTVTDYGKRVLGVEPKTTSEVTVEEHLAVLGTAQWWVDSAVSKTCNVPTDIEWEDFKGVYLDAWKIGAKGVTTFRLGGKRFGILNETEAAEEEAGEPVSACTVDLVTGKRECE
ncbi:MAG: ribonucleoside-diphosphate reductase, adenosylcobalamin-dependent [Planctomycetaceae bacterium]|nr:ribonucleoside-diphosphate reductase, adenosylcobalamin-dependent [Planctomycetaceae bacterium]